MPRPKSLVKTVEITVAGRLHSCRSNERHPIRKGQQRLTVRGDGNPKHYCLECGRRFIDNGIAALQELREQI